MTVTYKCPECNSEMNLQEDKHVCPDCDHSLSLDEAQEMFDAGDLVAIVEAKKDDKESEEESSEKDEMEDEDEEEEKKKPMKEDIDYKVDISEHVEALVSGEELSEEFQKKAATIFESAVNSKIAEISEQMKANFEIDLAEQTEEIRKDLTDKVDSYLDYVVSEWMEENKLAVENGLRTEITEDFINGLQNLFSESFIDVPEERYDLVESLASKVEELEGKLDEQIETNVKLSKEVNEKKADAVFAEVAEGLAVTEVEKFEGLVESIEFESEEQYREKLSTLKESYFKKNSSDSSSALTEEVIEESDPSADSDDEYGDLISAALTAIRNRDKN